MPRRWVAAVFLALIALTTSAGCGSSPPKLVPAEGVILIDGEPAADISVQFLPDEIEGEKRPTSYGVTDSEGRFVLKTYEQGEGAVVGGHSVILVDTLEERPEQGQELSAPPRLDSRYATITAGLRAEVTDGGGPITVDVSSSGPANAEREER
jgi:hypothetical protein